MIIYFLRHGLAGDRMEWTGDDELRPLTAQGVKFIEQTADYVNLLGLDLELILTSPLVRAFQTAEIMAKRLHIIEKLKQDKRLEPGFGMKELSEILLELKDLSNFMLVGHEPDFSQTISDLIGGGQVIMKKGGLARVDLVYPSSGRGELAWLIPPRILRS